MQHHLQIVESEKYVVLMDHYADTAPYVPAIGTRLVLINNDGDRMPWVVEDHHTVYSPSGIQIFVQVKKLN